MSNHYDFIACGAGSGGIAAAVQAAKHGKKVAVIECSTIGGTCVNLGCVPKKIMWYAGAVAEVIEDAPAYGFSGLQPEFSWSKLVSNRQSYINNIHKSYHKTFKKFNIDFIPGSAEFVDAKTLSANNQSFTAEHILIATGTQPIIPAIPGAEYGIDSDGFFALLERPKRVAIVGAGYIAVELAGFLHSLGCDTSLLIRRDKPLRSFDPLMSDTLLEIMQDHKLKVLTEHIPDKVIKGSDGRLTIHCQQDKQVTEIDTLVWAIGRKPRVDGLSVAKSGVEMDDLGYVATDKFQNTTVKNIYAVGDITGFKALTPVAVAAGRRLSRRLFNNETDLHLDYSNIATVVFSHPPIGTVGLTELQAIEKFGKEQVHVYQSRFTGMFDALTPQRVPTVMKLITMGDKERIGRSSSGMTKY